jgi:tetratricopeptide (TPR) repeat protein
MRTSMRGCAVVLVGLAVGVVGVVGCAKDEKKTVPNASVVATSGADAAELAAGASTAATKPVSKDAPYTPQPGLQGKGEGGAVKLIALPPVPKLAEVKKTEDTGPSLWGAPDAESGAPLPKRPVPNDAARDAYNAGQAGLTANNLPQAKQAYTRGIAADPKATYIGLYGLAVVADREGKPEDALQQYGKSLRAQADYELAVQGAVNIMLRRDNTAGAVAYVQPIATQWERNLYLQAILADVLVRADRVDEGEQAARKALKRDERFVPAIVALAKASLRRGRNELAESMLDQALEINKKYPEVHFLKGKIAQGKGDLGTALAAYKKAVDLRPDYAEARMALGIQYMASGNYKDALQQFEVTITLVPTLVAAHLNIGDAYRALKRWQDAKRAFDKALGMQPDLPEAHFNLALMYMAAGSTFPNLTELDALDRALTEFTTYRTQMGPRLSANDPSAAYMADVLRRQERERKRIEREKAKAEKEAARKAKEAQKAPAAGPSPTPAPK